MSGKIVILASKPRLFRADGQWVCVGLVRGTPHPVLRWFRPVKQAAGYGATPAAAWLAMQSAS